jgi:uncharacterized membrane protein
MPDPTTPSPVPQPAPAPTPPPDIPQSEIDSGKTMALLSYIPLFLIGLIVSIVNIATKNNAFSLYHGKQGLTLIICAFGAYLVCVPCMCIPFLNLLMIPVFLLLALGVLVFCILGIVNAASGKVKPLPFIGPLADKMFGNIQKQ